MKKMLMPRQTHKKLDEQGFASIVIALILIIVLALLTVGFAQLARREQRTALDKQLATQAYYAAESGVNDVQHQLTALKAAAALGHGPDPDTCLDQLPSGATIPATIGPAQNGVQYTCALVNLKPPSIVYGNIQPETMRYITSSSTTATGVGADSLIVNWGSADNHITYPNDTSGGLVPATQWGNRPGVLEFSLTPLNDLGRDKLTDNTFTVYLYPTKAGDVSGASIAYTTVSQPGSTNGKLLAARCNTGDAVYPCQATITGLTGGAGQYLFRVIDHYDSSNVSINGKAAGVATGFDGQVLIDVTGKAHEVLKRIQVHAPLKASADLAQHVLEAQNICKHFSTDPLATGGFTNVALPQDTTGACSYR